MADRKNYYSRGIADDLPDDLLPSDYFTIPGTDERGHSSRCQFRCSPELDRQVEEVISSKQYPFRTKGDLFRFAVFDTVRRLIRYGRHIPDFCRQLELTHIVLRRKLKMATFDETLDMLGNTIEELRHRGAAGEILEIFREMDIQIDNCVATDPEWGKRWKEQIDRRFGRLREELDRTSEAAHYVDFGKQLRARRNGDD